MMLVLQIAAVYTPGLQRVLHTELWLGSNHFM